MASYIDGFLASIPAGQRQALEALLDLQRSSGEISSTEEYQKELEKLLPLLQRGDDFKPGFEPQYVDETKPTRLSSNNFNDTFKAILADLSGLYTQINNADRTILAHSNVRKADWAKIRDAINKVTEDLVRHQYLKLNDGWQDVKYFDFWNARVNEPTAKAAAIDVDTKVLALGLKGTRRIEQLRGPVKTQAEVYEVSPAEAEGSSKDFKPENALDTNDKTFWAHLLLTDKTVITEWDGTDYQGAVVGYTVTFSNAEFVNYVSYLPFSSYPMQLIDLQYRDGDSWDTVPGFSAQTEGLDWQGVRFERIQANALRFIFLQRNFIRNKYLVPRHAFSLAKLWDQVLDEELLVGMEEEDLTEAQQLEIETNPRFRSYLYALKQVEDRLGESGVIRDVLEDQENMGRTVEALTKVVADNKKANGLILQNVVRQGTDAPEEEDEDLIEIDKVEYMFGLRQVRIQDNNYLPIGIYRSPKFAQRAMPYEIAVDATSSQVDLTAPEGSATYRESSLELELELSPDRRHNILPYGDTYVYDELCIISPNKLTGELRFTPSSPGSVQGRASGNLLTYGTDFSVSNNVVTILQGFSPNYRYTFSYTPQANQDILDVDSTYNSVALSTPEVFDHTDSHGMIDLSYYPYIAYEIVNNDTTWSKIEGDAQWLYRMGGGDVTIDGIGYGPTSGNRRYEPVSVYVNGAKALNITDYRSREHPAFRNDPDQPGVLQFIHAGKRLYFSRPLTGVTIEVQYRWMVQYIRLNVTLRGHKFIVNSYTPEVSDYKLLVRSGR